MRKIPIQTNQTTQKEEAVEEKEPDSPLKLTEEVTEEKK